MQEFVKDLSNFEGRHLVNFLKTLKTMFCGSAEWLSERLSSGHL